MRGPEHLTSGHAADGEKSDHLALQRLRPNLPLTLDDLEALDEMLVALVGPAPGQRSPRRRRLQ